LKNRPNRHRFVFIGFAGEEGGLLGSREYVKKLPKEAVGAIQAMVNLECLGTTPPKVWANRADQRLLNAYAAVMHALHQEAVASNVEKVGDDDSHPFLNARVPVITIHSITQETLPVLHSNRDSLQAIHPDDYYAAYRVVALYLAYLDSALD
jgi:Zn-dependent M28 family amino/carboxypeptidase